MAQCWPLTGMTILQKAVLISMADQANDDGHCWPSVGSVGKRVCAEERAVRDAIKWLCENGYLRRSFNLGQRTDYWVTPAGNAPLHDMPPASNEGTPRQQTTETPAGNASRTIKNRKANVSKRAGARESSFLDKHKDMSWADGLD
jgi:hypothetical protein